MDTYSSNSEFFNILMEEAPEPLLSDMTDIETDSEYSEYIAVIERLNLDTMAEL